jgi:hypothetical protein
MEFSGLWSCQAGRYNACARMKDEYEGVALAFGTHTLRMGSEYWNRHTRRHEKSHRDGVNIHVLGQRIIQGYCTERDVYAIGRPVRTCMARLETRTNS